MRKLSCLTTDEGTVENDRVGGCGGSLACTPPPQTHSELRTRLRKRASLQEPALGNGPAETGAMAGPARREAGGRGASASTSPDRGNRRPRTKQPEV